MRVISPKEDDGSRRHADSVRLGIARGDRVQLAVGVGEALKVVRRIIAAWGLESLSDHAAYKCVCQW